MGSFLNNPACNSNSIQLFAMHHLTLQERSSSTSFYEVVVMEWKFKSVRYHQRLCTAHIHEVRTVHKHVPFDDCIRRQCHIAQRTHPKNASRSSLLIFSDISTENSDLQWPKTPRDSLGCESDRQPAAFSPRG